MALNIVRKATTFRNCFLVKNASSRRRYSLYEPDYLEAAKNKIPSYPALNMKITGYSYPVVEKYQSFVHKTATNMDIEVDNCWPLPSTVLKIQRFKRNTTTIDAEFDLNIYERNIILLDVSSIECSLLVRVLEAALPEGVTLNIDIFDPDSEKKRYIPDKELLDYKSMLETLKGNKQ